MIISIEAIPIDGKLPIPCDFELCELDATVRVTAPELVTDHGTDGYHKTPLCTGHAHVIVAEALLGL